MQNTVPDKNVNMSNFYKANRELTDSGVQDKIRISTATDLWCITGTCAETVFTGSKPAIWITTEALVAKLNSCIQEPLKIEEMHTVRNIRSWNVFLRELWSEMLHYNLFAVNQQILMLKVFAKENIFSNTTITTSTKFTILTLLVDLFVFENLLNQVLHIICNHR